LDEGKRMQIGITIRLKDFQSIRIISSEFPNVKLCLRELDSVLSLFEQEEVKRFREEVIVPVLRKVNKRNKE